MKQDIKFEFVQRILDTTNFTPEANLLKYPERSTRNAAGYDFYNFEEVTIQPKEIVYVKTGIKAKFPEDVALLLLNRSSNPKKKGLLLANGIGLVDADYYNNTDNEGEIAFAFLNIKDEPVTLLPGEKLGQGMFVNFKTAGDIVYVERDGGFGSTGK